ncbi:MAG TPA: nuclear transport factor 2 family protein [Candidatus Acidoferrum sp.]|nr:nuclear transport factor 2 family protein [Candidatus Acidoferrum sp.]
MAKTRMASETIESKNKAFVLEAFDILFNKRDYAAAERFWSPNYIQHSAHIAPGREGLFELVRSVPETMHYENQLIVAEGDYVIAHGRFTGMGRPAAWIAADVIRFEDGVLKEHWDVLQATPALLLLGALAGAVQLLDAGIGLFDHDLGKCAGPLFIAVLQFLVVYLLHRSVRIAPLARQ